jgi:hypothetical protein
MQVQIQTLTPEYAAALLAKNTANRPLSSSHAESLARSIQRGEWKLNGDAIRIAIDGTLLDGQHRLAAIVRAGIPVQSLVVGGLSNEVFDTIDVGAKRRGTSDVMAILGERNYSTLSAAAHLYHQYTNYGSPFMRNKDKIPSAQQLIALVNANPILRDATHFAASSVWVKRNMTCSIGAFCWAALSEHNAARAERFFHLLTTGAGLENGSPVLLLRERLMEKDTAITTVSREYKTALVFKAFRHFVRGNTLITLRIRTEGDKVETDLFNLNKKDYVGPRAA